jgi:hypothetical protein
VVVVVVVVVIVIVVVVVVVVVEVVVVALNMRKIQKINFQLRNFSISSYITSILSNNTLVEMFVILLLGTQIMFRFRAEQLIKSRAKLVLFKFLALKTRQEMCAAIT